MARVNEATATNSFFGKVGRLSSAYLGTACHFRSMVKTDEPNSAFAGTYVISEYEDAKKSGRSQNFV